MLLLEYHRSGRIPCRSSILTTAKDMAVSKTLNVACGTLVSFYLMLYLSIEPILVDQLYLLTFYLA